MWVDIMQILFVWQWWYLNLSSICLVSFFQRSECSKKALESYIVTQILSKKCSHLTTKSVTRSGWICHKSSFHDPKWWYLNLSSDPFTLIFPHAEVKTELKSLPHKPRSRAAVLWRRWQLWEGCQLWEVLNIFITRHLSWWLPSPDWY